MERPEAKLELSKRLSRRLVPLMLGMGFLISISLPVTYYFLGSKHLQRTANIYALELAEELQEFIVESPKLWTYQTPKFIKTLHGFISYKDLTNIRVLDEKGSQITQYEYGSLETSSWWDLFPPEGSAPIIFNNRTLGTVQVSISRGSLVNVTLALFLAFTILGVGLASLAFFSPVKVVRGMEKQIQDLIGELRIELTERKQIEEILRESEERYRSILENIEDGYFEVDVGGKFTFFNNSLYRMLQYSREEMMGMNNKQYMDEEGAQKIYQGFNRVYRTGEPNRAFNWEIIRKDGQKGIFEGSISLMRNVRGEPIGFRGIACDITERKRTEEEREKLIQELQNALSQVKALKGLLPICASCKKIRDDSGYWNQIESYIRDHSEAEFSHGICPDCMKKLYPDFAD